MIQTSRTFRLFWLLGGVLLFASAAVGFVLHPPASGTSPALTLDANSGGVIGIGYGDVDTGITALHPLQAGRVDAVYVKEGDEVNEGELLLSLDNQAARYRLNEAGADLAVAKRRLEEAETQLAKIWQFEVQKQSDQLEMAREELKVAEANLKLVQNAMERHLSTQEALNVATGTVEQLKAKVALCNTVLDQTKIKDPKATIDRARDDVKAKQAQRDLAHLALVECDLYAPADGIILRLFATPGDLMTTQPHQPAVQFCPNAARIVRADILQEFASKIQKGQIALIEDDTRNGLKWKGKVERVSPIFLPRRAPIQEPFQYNDVRTLECIIHIDPSSQPLRINQRVRVTILQGGP